MEFLIRYMPEQLSTLVISFNQCQAGLPSLDRPHKQVPKAIFLNNILHMPALLKLEKTGYGFTIVSDPW